MANNFSIRDKSILVGLYLSRFDEKGLQTLGFDGAKQAFNILGYAIGSKPASIKNYRDEFDPYFPNSRKGWHKRAIREYCKKILDDFSNLDFETFTELIKSFLFSNYEIEALIEKNGNKDKSESVAKRLVTGKAAEEYFKSAYLKIADFANHSLKDTTNLACGFDYQLSSDVNFYCVEVKGLNLSTGSISMTEKEFLVAQNLKERYCLFVVSNFIETPNHQFFFDPLNSRLTFKRIERQVLQTNYHTVL